VKIEQLIVQYLYLTKQVTLQGIGTFKLDPAVVLPAGNEKEKDFVMPENAFQFEYNLKAGEDEGLVRYIVQHTRKILPLASSDLESYAMLAKQFLNIGKPLVIEGVGTVQKNQQGNYQFIPGVFITPKIDDYPKQIREKRDESVSFETEGKLNNSRRNLVAVIAVLVIILVGLGIYYVLMNKKTIEPEPVAQTEAITDTAMKNSFNKTGTGTPLNVAPPITESGSDSFNIVVKNYSNYESAVNAFKRFSDYGHRLKVQKAADSLNYELTMSFKRPFSDTSRAKDSLSKIFGGFPYVRF
jgi:hypothetical protein